MLSEVDIVIVFALGLQNWDHLVAEKIRVEVVQWIQLKLSIIFLIFVGSIIIIVLKQCDQKIDKITIAFSW